MNPEHGEPLGAPRAPEEDEGLPLAEYLSIILDEWRLFLAPVALCLLLAMAYVITATPTYRASGVIQVGDERF
jgi:uncharacterized protein involved in exopolysaccharide biosynthesis